MKRFIPIASRLMPRMFKTFILGVGLHMITKNNDSFMRKTYCFNFKGED